MPTPPQLPICFPIRPLVASIIPAAVAAGEVATAKPPLASWPAAVVWSMGRPWYALVFQTELSRLDNPGKAGLPLRAGANI